MVGRIPRSWSAMAAAAALGVGGCSATDYAASRVADGLATYCSLTPAARDAVRVELRARLAPGHELRATCPGELVGDDA